MGNTAIVIKRSSLNLKQTKYQSGQQYDPCTVYFSDVHGIKTRTANKFFAVPGMFPRSGGTCVKSRLQKIPTIACYTCPCLPPSPSYSSSGRAVTTRGLSPSLPLQHLIWPLFSPRRSRGARVSSHLVLTKMSCGGCLLMLDSLLLARWRESLVPGEGFWILAHSSLQVSSN